MKMFDQHNSKLGQVGFACASVEKLQCWAMSSSHWMEDFQRLDFWTVISKYIINLDLFKQTIF